MPRQYSIAEAREKLAHVIQEAEQGAKVELTRRGKPVALLLSLTEYHRLAHRRGSFWESYRLSGSPDSFWASYQEFRRKCRDLAADTADAFADVRDPSPGR